jgi:hypothetical protein
MDHESDTYVLSSQTKLTYAVIHHRLICVKLQELQAKQTLYLAVLEPTPHKIGEMVKYIPSLK